MIEYENLHKLNAPFTESYLEQFKRVNESGWYILGNQVRQFESDFAAFNHAPFCVGVANGLDALIIALKAFAFKPSSEVIVPSNTYIATILSILHCGLKPVLVEPDLKTYNIDPARIEDAITSSTAAIMVVHLYGKCCDMDPILNITKQHNLKLIEDCAQAHGAKYKGKLAGSFGHFGAFSFYPTKNLGALGDAGAIVTSDEELYLRARKLRNYGSEKKYYNEVVGFNSRLDEMQASFLNIKLKHLESINSHKRKLAKIYSMEVSDNFIKPVTDTDYVDVYHIYNIRHSRRDLLRDFLLKEGIGTEIHYPVPPHKQKAMIGLLENEQYPISTEIHNTTLSLPISFFHAESDIIQVVEALNRF